MIKIGYDPETEVFVFMASPAEDETVMNVDELLEGVAGEFALFASCIAGSTTDAYYGLVNALESAGQDIEMKEGIRELLDENKKTVFLNNESVDECLTIMARNFEEDTDDMMKLLLTDSEEKIFVKQLKEKLIDSFIDNMNDMLEVDMRPYFNKPKEEKVEENSDYEDDLF